MRKIFFLGTFVCVLLRLNLYAYDISLNGVGYNVNATLRTVSVAGKSGGEDIVIIPSQVEYKGLLLPVTSINESAFRNSKLVEIEIPSSVKTIGRSAFLDCINLSKVNIPDAVSVIEAATFAGCKSLREINIPKSISKISESAFASTGLKKVIFEDGENDLTFIGGTPFGRSHIVESRPLTTDVYVYLGRNIKLVDYDGYPIFLPSTDNERFPFGELAIKKIVIGSGVTELPGYFCARCPIKELLIPANVTTIAHDFLIDCSLRKLIFEDAIENLVVGTIPDAMLPTVEYLYIGRPIIYKYGQIDGNSTMWESVNTLVCGEAAFSADPPFSYYTGYESYMNYPTEVGNSILINNTTPPGYSSFSNKTYLNTILYVPKGSIEIYKNAKPWKYFFDIQEFTDIEDYVINVAINQPSSCKEQILTKNGTITISGIESNSNVSIYDINGIFIDTKTCIDNQIIFNTKIPQGNVVIVQIGEKMYKVLMNYYGVASPFFPLNSLSSR